MLRKASGKLLTAALFVLFPIGLVGCGDDDKCANCPEPGPATPAKVVDALQLAYKNRDGAAYANLLADDFTFWFDPPSRPAGVPDSWTRLQDSTGTGNLFAATAISDIRISLAFDSLDKPDNAPTHPGWRKILVTDTFLEVDKEPDNGIGEVTTFRVDGDEQQFYFRKGRSPADTLASSPTAGEWFLVEWHDLAHPNAIGRLTPSAQSTTWSSLKAAFAN